MAGYPEQNFPLFDAARDALKRLHYVVSSPADITRQYFATRGGWPAPAADIEAHRAKMMYFDLSAVLTAESVCLLPGWTKSCSATLEALVAANTGKNFMSYLPEADRVIAAWVPTSRIDFMARWHADAEESRARSIHIGSATGVTKGDPAESICSEADRLVDGARQKNYGHPLKNYTRVAELWSAYQGRELSAEDVVTMMMLLKIGRLMNGFHRDSVVDIAGYAKCLDLIHTKRES